MKKCLFVLFAVVLAFCAGCGPRSAIPLDSSQPDTIWTLEVIPSGGEDAEGINLLRDRTAEVLSNRLKRLGLSQASVSPDGDSLIAVRLPGMQQEGLDRVLGVLLQPARLEFRVVAERNDEWVQELFDSKQVPEDYAIVDRYWEHIGYPPDAKELARIREFAPHDGFDLLLELRTENGKMRFRPWYVSRHVELDGKDLASATVGTSQFGEAEIDLTFTDEGQRKFAELTRELAPGGAKNPTFNERRYLAIVWDGDVLSAPFVREEIAGGRATITGAFSREEAQILVKGLTAAPLPCDLRLIEVAPVP